MAIRITRILGVALLSAVLATPAMQAFAPDAAQQQPPATPQAEKAPKPAPAPRAREDRARAVHVATAGGSYLGISSRDVTAERLAALKLKEERGVEVVELDQDGPAGKAGLRPGDVILEFNGARVESVQQLRRMLGEIPPGRTATLGISREGQAQSLQVQLGERARSAMVFRTAPDGGFHFEMPPMPPMPAMPPRPPVAPVHVMAFRAPVHGLVVENLNQQLGEYFGVKNGEGVLVRSVEKGSLAEKAGFRAGDVIVQVQDERIVDFSDFRRVLRRQKSGTVPVRVVREKREQSLSLTIPEGREETSWEVDFDFDWKEMRREIERLRPEIERMAYSLSETAARELRANSAEIEKAVRQAAREAERAVEEVERVMRERRKEAEKEVEKQRRD